MYDKLVEATIQALQTNLNEDKEIKHKELLNNVKEFYTAHFEDELGSDIDSNITFLDIYRNLKYSNQRGNKSIYQLIGVNDSVVRERIFNELCNILNCDRFYLDDLWTYGAYTDNFYPRVNIIVE